MRIVQTKHIIFLTLLLLWSSEPMIHAQGQTLDQDIAQKEKSLQHIRIRIEACRQELGQLHGRETTLLDSIRTIEQELFLLHQLIEQLILRRNELEHDIGLLNAELRLTQDRLEIHRQRLAHRLREMYKRGRSQQLEILLTASSPVDLFRRYTYLRAASEADRNILLEVKAIHAHLESTKDEIELKLSQNKRVQQEKTQEEERIQHLVEQRRRQVIMVQGQMSTSEQMLNELKEEAEQLEQIIERLEEERLRLEAQRQHEDRILTYEDFAQYKGRLPWPTTGRVIHSFGPHRHPVFKTTTINKGIDIQAPQGADVFAVATADVILIDWLRGYGKFIILDHHGGYYTLYAHTSEILVTEGEGIQGGERIATVGDTGSLEGPMLHFEIRRGKQELDPSAWLREE